MAGHKASELFSLRSRTNVRWEGAWRIAWRSARCYSQRSRQQIVWQKVLYHAPAIPGSSMYLSLRNSCLSVLGGPCFFESTEWNELRPRSGFKHHKQSMSQRLSWLSAFIGGEWDSYARPHKPYNICNMKNWCLNGRTQSNTLWQTPQILQHRRGGG